MNVKQNMKTFHLVFIKAQNLVHVLRKPFLRKEERERQMVYCHYALTFINP